MSSNNVVTHKWYFNPVYWLLIIVAVPIAWVLITQEPDKRQPAYGYTQGLTVYSPYLHKLEEQLKKMEDGKTYVPPAMKLMENQKVQIIHRYSNGGFGNYFDDLYKVNIGGTDIYLWSRGLYTLNANGVRIEYIESTFK